MLGRRRGVGSDEEGRTVLVSAVLVSDGLGDTGFGDTGLTCDGAIG